MPEPKTKVMIGSAARDLPEHRREVLDACLRQSMFPVMMEHLLAADADAIAESLRMVDEAEVYLGIFAHRYGYVPKGHDISIAEMEYNRAVERGIPRLIFVIDRTHPISIDDVEIGEGSVKLQALKQRLLTDNIVNFFRSPADLRAQTINSLSKLREPDLTAFHYVRDIPPPPEPYIAHPYTLLQTRGLVGRQAELNLLTDWVAQPRAPVHQACILNVVAIGGMGKSALTWKWFSEIAPLEMHPLAGRLWWSFYESDAHFENFVIRALAYVSGRAREDIEKNTRPGEREDLLLQILDREPHLLVLDGLERILIAYARLDAARLADHDLDQQTANYVTGALGLPESAAQSLMGQHRLRKTADPRAGSFLRKLASVRTARILISTRLYPADLQIGTGASIPGSFAYFLTGLADDDALALWRAFGVSGAREELLPLFGTFGNHPLLIQVLASEVKHYRRAPGDFDAWRRAHPGFDPFRLPLTEVRSDVLEFALRGLDQAGRKALQTIAAFRMPAPYDTLAALLIGKDKLFSDETALDAVLADLEDRGLLGWDRRANRYDLHPIVRGLTWSEPDEQTKQAIYVNLQRHFESLPTIEDWREINSLDDLTAAIELYNSLIGLYRYDDAYDLFFKRLYKPLIYRLGASQQSSELVELLFVNGLDQLPHLSDANAQASALGALARAYELSGQPARAISLLRRQITFYKDDQKRQGIRLYNLGSALRLVGQLRDAEASARHALSIHREQDDYLREASSLLLLGLTLATRNMMSDADEAFGRSLRIVVDLSEAQFEASVYANLAQRSLWAGDFSDAQPQANRAWELANIQRYEASIIRSARLQGAAALELGDSTLADERLHHALSRARAVNLVEEEIATLIGLAELRRRQADLEAARELLDDVWELAERGPYPLLHADAYNVLTQIERDTGNAAAAIEAAITAYRLAWCDGPPFVYHWGLEAARTHLSTFKVSAPSDLPVYNEYAYESMVVVEIDLPDAFGHQKLREKFDQYERSTTRHTGQKITPPVYLLSITVKDIRCFGKSQTIDLSNGKGKPARWTVILGDNGVGKTTLLQCLAAVDGQINPFFLREQGLFVESVETRRNRLFDQEGNYAQISGTVYFGAKLDGRKRGQTIKTAFIKAQRIHGKDDIEKLNTIDNLICYGYGASRRMEETALSSRTPEESSITLFSDDVALRNPEEWLLQTDYAANVPSLIQDEAKRRFNDVKSLLTNLLPDVNDIRIASPGPTQPQPAVEVCTSNGWIPLRGMSLGYRTLTAWMVDLARRMFERYPDSLRPIAEPAVVLVDEIDLHLHPQWQRTLMSFLSGWFENTQFIVTAHSPLVVQAAADANIVLLRRAKDQVEIVNDVKAIRGWRIDQVLTSDLFGLPSARPPEMDELLAQRRTILSKAILTQEDEENLLSLESQIGKLPAGETPQDIEAMDIIHRAAALLKRQTSDR